MPTDAFYKNVVWNLNLVSVQVAHAESVKGRARSGYYKVAIILASTIVEALAYTILENNRSRQMPLEDWKCQNSQYLSSIFVSRNGEKLSICERVRPIFNLNQQTDFKKVNEVCLKLSLYHKKLFRKIEKIRILRNKIHIQGLKNIDRSYRKQELEFVSSAIDDLLKLLRP